MHILCLLSLPPLLICTTQQMGKAMLPVFNIPMISYILRSLVRAKFDGVDVALFKRPMLFLPMKMLSIF